MPDFELCPTSPWVLATFLQNRTGVEKEVGCVFVTLLALNTAFVPYHYSLCLCFGGIFLGLLTCMF